MMDTLGRGLHEPPPDHGQQQASGPRLPPHSDEAEMALIGAILHHNQAYDTVSAYLKPQHFANRIHGRIYEAIGVLIDRSMVADAITLKQFFEHDADLAEIGGYSYLVKLQGSVASVVNAGDYGLAIFDMHRRRVMLQIGEDLANLAWSEDYKLDLAAEIAKRETLLGELGHSAEEEEDDGHVVEAIGEYEERLRASARVAEGRVLGVPTTLRALDQLLGGLMPGKVIVIGGPPGSGKTTLTWQMIWQAAQTEMAEDPARTYAGAMFSIEVGKAELLSRTIASETGLGTREQFGGRLRQQDYEAILGVTDRLRRLPLWIDHARLTISRLKSKVRRIVRKHGKLSVLAIDFLQLMSRDDLPKGNDTSHLSYITRELKLLAEEHECALLLLSSISRDWTKREDPRPLMADLRDSGSIEFDADIVLFTFREDEYLLTQEPKQTGREGAGAFSDRYKIWTDRYEACRGKVEIICRKHRGGPLGTVYGAFHGAGYKISDLEDRQRPAPGLFTAAQHANQGPSLDAYEGEL